MADYKIKDSVTVLKGKPMWRSLDQDDRVEWAMSAAAQKPKSDGTPATPPLGILRDGDGTEVYRVYCASVTSTIFGVSKSGCVLLIDSKKRYWYAEKENVELVVKAPRVPPAPPSTEDDVLLGFVPLDIAPNSPGARAGKTPEQLAEMDAKREARNAARLVRAMDEIGALNLEVRARVEVIRKKWGLSGVWVGGVQIRNS